MRTVIALLALASSAAVSGAPNLDDHLLMKSSYRLQLPRYAATPTRDTLGRITAIKVTVRCGYIIGLSRIPADWSVEIHREITETTSDGWTLMASAGHGATYLYKLETWNNSIAIAPYEQSCFDVSAAFVTEGDDGQVPREHFLTRKQLKLNK